MNPHCVSRKQPEFSHKRIFGNTFILSFLIIAFSSFVTVVFFRSGSYRIFFKEQGAAIHTGYAWWCIVLILAYLVFEYGSKILLGLQKFISYNKTYLFRPVILFILLVFAYFFWGLNIKIALIIYSISWIVPGLFMLRVTLPFRPLFDREISRNFILYGIKIMATNVFTFLSYRADIFFIGYFWSSEPVGWYYVAMVIAEKLHFLTQPTSTILFPAAAHSVSQQEKTPILVRVNFFIIFCGAVFIAFFARWLVPLIFSAKYTNSVLPLIILMPGITALTIPKILNSDLAARGLPHISMYVAGIILLVKVVLSVLLIPGMGIAGAALAGSLSYLLAAVIIVIVYRKLTGTPVNELLLLRFRDLKGLKKI